MTTLQPDEEESAETPDEEALEDLRQGLRELRLAEPDYNRAVRMAKGQFEEFQSRNLRIREILEQSAKTYLFKLAHVPLRVMGDRMKLTGITVDAGTQKAWDAVWKANNMDVWSKEVQDRGFKFGDSYMRAWPDESADNTGAEDADVVDAGVTLSYLDPRFARVIYDPQDERKPLFAIMTWTEDGFDWAMLEYRDRILHFSKRRGTTGSVALRTNDVDAIARDNASGITQQSNWVASDYVKSERMPDGTVEETVIPASQPNEWGEITVKHFRTAMPYGVPEHFAAYGPASAIAKLLVTQLATVDTQGWATRYGLIDNAAILDNAGEQVDWADDADAPTLDQIKDRSRAPRQSRPGEMEIFDNLKDVGEWSAADPKVFTDPVELYLKIMSTTTATPFYSFDPGGEQPSGKAREIADEPLNAKIEDRETRLGSTWIELTRLALKMIGKSTKECAPKWKPHTLATTVDDWLAVKAQQEAGMPMKESLVRAGLPPDEVDQWMEEKNELAVSTGSIELLGALGDALQRLGHTAQTPLVSQETLGGVISSLMGQFVVAPLDPTLVQEQAEAEQKAQMIQQQMAAGTHDETGKPLPPTLNKDGKVVKPPGATSKPTAPVAIQPPKVVGDSTKQAAKDNGAPKG